MTTDRLINLRTAISSAINIAEDEYPVVGSRSKGVAAKHVRMLAILQEALNQDDLRNTSTEKESG